MNNNPIGIFDSGVGGLSVFKEVAKLLPSESIIYYADSKNCPYGEKSQNEIIKLSEKIVDFLIANKCKIIIVACNTATASAINYLRERYTMPFIGMEPAVKPAAQTTRTNNIGILATAGTFKGNLYKKTKEKFAQNIIVHTQIGKGLVELVENNNLSSKEAYNLVSKYIIPFVDANVDKVVLGCTHYPFLCKLINEILSDSDIEIINPAPAIAQQTKNIIETNNLQTKPNNKSKYKFFTSGNNMELIKSMVSKFNITEYFISKI